ncbi:hypothetical protein [Xanthocytophaga flava]|uniref:hypothetical protein n=1 Tax=Xanthocytophaga flava TaxID=3048013 RepID=UPI0028D1DD2F|nr:hypothetical protein [Xanthocytophaga flavus]MDJ1472155.1 hypothetical protein [Xanthocytophaga flavus]
MQAGFQKVDTIIGYAVLAGGNNFTGLQTLDDSNAVGTPSWDFRKSNLTMPSLADIGFQPSFLSGTVGRIGGSSSTTEGLVVNGFTTSSTSAIPLDFVAYHGSNAPTSAGILFRVRKHSATSGLWRWQTQNYWQMCRITQLLVLKYMHLG